MEHHIKNGDQIMFNTNSAHKAILCPKNFLIVLTALVCFLSSAVVSAQEARMLSPISQLGLIPGNSCDAGLTEPISDSDRTNCIEIHADNFDTENTTNISRTLAPSDANSTGIVDWIIVELRVFNNGNVATGNPDDADDIYRQPALLRSDGTVVNATAEDLLAEEGDDSILTLGFEGFDDSTQDAYIIIEHRYHLGVMSAQAVTPDEEYNFSASSDQVMGGSTGAIQKSGIWSSFGGDLNGDAQISGSGDVPIAIDNLFERGYHAGADIDLSGVTQGTADLPIILGSLFERQRYNSSN